MKVNTEKTCGNCAYAVFNDDYEGVARCDKWREIVNTCALETCYTTKKELEQINANQLKLNVDQVQQLTFDL